MAHQPSWSHLIAWRCTQSKQGCGWQCHTEWQIEGSPRRTGISSLKADPQALEAKCPCTGTVYTQMRSCPVPLLPPWWWWEERWASDLFCRQAWWKRAVCLHGPLKCRLSVWTLPPLCFTPAQAHANSYRSPFTSVKTLPCLTSYEPAPVASQAQLSSPHGHTHLHNHERLLKRHSGCSSHLNRVYMFILSGCSFQSVPQALSRHTVTFRRVWIKYCSLSGVETSRVATTFWRKCCLGCFNWSDQTN